MQKKYWYHNLRLKLLVVLCAVLLLGQGLFVRPTLASPAAADNARPRANSSDRDPNFSVISRSPGTLDIFIVNGPTNEIWMKSWTGSIWTNWRNLGRAANGDPFYTVYAVAAGNNRWDIFATVGFRGNRVWHKAFDGVVEYGWESRGDAGLGAANGIQAVSWGTGEIDLFTRGTRSSSGTGPVLWKRRFANGVWDPCDTCAWTVLDANTAKEDFGFSALAHSDNRIDLFRQSKSDLKILRRFFNGINWGFNSWDWMSGGLAKQTPYAVSWGSYRIDVFVRGSDNNVWIDSTNNPDISWSGWNFLGRGATNNTSNAAAVSAVAWGPNRLDIFTREDTTAYHKAWDGTNWLPNQTGGWDNIGSMPTNILAHPPLPVSWGPGRIDLFYYEHTNAVPNSRTLYHKWTNDGANWGPSQTDWESLGP